MDDVIVDKSIVYLGDQLTASVTAWHTDNRALIYTWSSAYGALSVTGPTIANSVKYLAPDQPTTEILSVTVAAPESVAVKKSVSFPVIKKSDSAAKPAATWIELARVAVNPSPLPGQSWRASLNFGTFSPREVHRLRWTVVEAEAQAAKFSVAQDVRMGRDPTLFSALGSNSDTPVIDASHLYIGDVSGATEPFTVVVYGE